MQQLPYELLQYISSQLLPRSQCRLAMASRHNYKYLYNDLLKWHARKSAILPPKYKYLRMGCTNCSISLIEFNKQLILFNEILIDELFIYNLTHQWVTIFDHTLNYNIYYHTELNIGEMVELCEDLRDTNILTGCYRYIHKTPLLVYLSSRHPFITIPLEILDKIMDMLTESDIKTFTTTIPYLKYM